MAQPDAPKKSTPPLIKVLVGIAMALAAGGGADAAGYLPDVQVLKDLGIVGAVLLIVYFELRIRPLAVVIASALAPKATAQEEAEQTIVLEAEPPPRRGVVQLVVPAREPP